MNNIRIEQSANGALGVLSGQKVSSFALKLPNLPTNKLLKALPHLMADSLAVDSEKTVFCLSGKNADGLTIVLACEVNAIEDLLAEAKERKVELTSIWPDYMEITPPASGTAIVNNNGVILARRADGTGFSLPAPLADIALSDEKTTEAVRVSFPNETPGFAYGRFSPNLQLGKTLKRYRRALFLMILASLLWLSSVGLEGLQNVRKRSALENASVELYRQQFPDAKRIVNVEAQLKGKLGSSMNASGFFGLMERFQLEMERQTTARMEEFNYVEEPVPSLKLIIVTPGFAELEKFRLALSQSGFQVSVGRSEQVNELIRNEITLTFSGKNR